MRTSGARSLRLVVSRPRGAAPALLLAALLPAGTSCSAASQVEAQPSGGGDAGVGGSGAATSSGSGAGGWNGSSGMGGLGGADPCGWASETFVVEVPPEGVPALPGEICAVAVTPVQSNMAARVTLHKYSQALHLATGAIAIEPALLADVVGPPAIAVVDASSPCDGELPGMQVTAMTPTAGGFSFHAQWPEPFFVYPDPWCRMTVKTTFELRCDPQGNTTRYVEALTHIHLCVEDGELDWVSSGDECTACSAVPTEMAPSPIVPTARGDRLPLARALRLRLAVLATVGRSLVLFAENDGGAGLRYRWQPSAGEVAELAADVVVWTLPEGRGPHLMQVAVHGADCAAVASWRTDRAA